MIIDAMDILYSGNCDGFVLVSSDSDFTRLAIRLREAGMKVYGMGEKKTPKPFIVACDKFVYIEVIRAAAKQAAAQQSEDEPSKTDAKAQKHASKKESKKSAGQQLRHPRRYCRTHRRVGGGRVRRGRLRPHGQAGQPAAEKAARLRPPELRLLQAVQADPRPGRFDWKTEGTDNSEYFVRDTQRDRE